MAIAAEEMRFRFIIVVTQPSQSLSRHDADIPEVQETRPFALCWKDSGSLPLAGRQISVVIILFPG